jgi:3-oxoacyl-[acyl-carrier-protein] synthase-3
MSALRASPVRAAISGIGSALPAGTITTPDLAHALGVDPEWIRRRTGIETRHQIQAPQTLAELATQAAQAALCDAQLSPDALDLILVATVSPDSPTPAVAPLVQAALGAHCGSLDLSAACAGFVYALALARGQIESGLAQHILIIGAEHLTPLLAADDPDTRILFGDGAGALVLSAATDGRGIVAHHLGSDGHAAHLLGIRDGLIHMQGREVFRRALRDLELSARAVCSAAGWQPDEVHRWVPHQANARITHALTKRLGVPAAHVVRHLEHVGNTSAASIPLALAAAQGDGRLRPDQKVVMCAIGAGLVWGSVALIW